jgi:hypothetical protein
MGERSEAPTVRGRFSYLDAFTLKKVSLAAFAASMDGYEEWGSLENLAPLANTVSAYWSRTDEIAPVDLRALRGCLFFEHRRHHHYGHIPDAETTTYIRALVERIRELVVAQVTPP